MLGKLKIRMDYFFIRRFVVICFLLIIKKHSCIIKII